MVKVTKLDSFGRGITYINDLITFIPNTLPEEEIEVEITKVKKNFQEGKCTRILEESSKRIKPKCPLFGICGGCDLQHLLYEDTVDYKKNKIKELFKRNDLDYSKLNFIKSKNEYNYRNKVTLKVVNGDIGYYINETHDLVKINKCFLAKECINDLIELLHFSNDESGEITIRSNNNNELLVSLDGNLTFNRNEYPDTIKICGVITNGKPIYGEESFVHKIGDLYFKISYDSFFQINDDICQELFSIVNENITTGNVLDLYCGVGSLGLNVSNYNKLFGIEIVPNAIKNAITNASINHKSNTYYMLGDASKIINKINDNINNLIVDPPRKGLDKETINYIFNNDINKIIYISCNPDTLVRDLKLINDQYNITKVYACDMFPYTYHVETVCVLERK